MQPPYSAASLEKRMDAEISVLSKLSMSGSKGADVDDQDAADAANQETLVLDRLLYRNRSQHRSAKYFTLALEVRRACRSFAAPDVPELLAKSLGVLARVPDSRNNRAREAWVRSAAAALQRMSIAAVVCAEVLEATVQASKHLAHQVSQTYFMALSVVFLACLARLFVCSLHLGGRLLEVHGALLRTLLAQPSTSECLPAAALAACRIPEETATFLSRLRGAGRANKLRGLKTPNRAAASAATASRGILGATPTGSSMPSPFPTTGRTGGKGGVAVEGRGDVGSASGVLHAGGDGDGDDSDDTGVRIGRAVAMGQVEKNPTAGKVFRGEGAVAAAAKMVERQGGRRGKAENNVGRTGREAERSRRPSGDDGGGHDNERRVEPPRKKVILASEFSDSSDDESDSRSTTKPEQQQQQQPQQHSPESATAMSPMGAKASRSGSTPRRPFLPSPRVSSSAKKPSHSQPSTVSNTVATASVSLAGGTRSDGLGVVGVGRASAPPPEEVPPGGRVGWMIDRGPAFAATPPRCASEREGDFVPSSSSSSAAAASPRGEEASPGIPDAPSDVVDEVAEGTRCKVDALAVGAETSSDVRSIDSGAWVVETTADVPGATTGEGAHVCEVQVSSCVAGDQASTAAPGVDGVAGTSPTSPVSFFGSSSSAVNLTSSCSATGETRRRKKGGKGRKQVAPKRKGPPSSLPTPSMPTPSAVVVSRYDRKTAAPSPSAPTSDKAVSHCRKSVVGGNRGEGEIGGKMPVTGGGTEKKDWGGVGGSPTTVSLLPEAALPPDAVAMRAAVVAETAAAVTTAAPPLAAPSYREVHHKVSGSSMLQQTGRTSRKERSELISGAGDNHSGSGSGAKRSPAGEARGEMANRKKKKNTKKTSKGSTKRSAGGQGGGRNAIDDIFGSLT